MGCLSPPQLRAHPWPGVPPGMEHPQLPGDTELGAVLTAQCHLAITVTSFLRNSLLPSELTVITPPAERRSLG